jgi:hypothetical protein
MNDIITIAGLKRLSLPELRRLEAELCRQAARHAEGSAQRRRILADLTLVRAEIALRLTRGPRPGFGPG